MKTYSAGRHFVTWAALAAVLLVPFPAPSAAQEAVTSFNTPTTRPEPAAPVAPSSSARRVPRIAVGISAGVAWQADVGDGASNYSGFDWVANARIGLTTHLALEPEVGRWVHSQGTEYAGAGGRVDKAEFSQSNWYVGANLIGRVPGRRLSFFYGGGASVWRVSEEFSLETSAPSAPPATEHWDYAATKFGVQGVAGLDVNVTSRLQVFGVTRLQIVNREMYPFVFAVHGGVRVGL